MSHISGPSAEFAKPGVFLGLVCLLASDLVHKENGHGNKKPCKKYSARQGLAPLHRWNIPSL